MQYHEWMEEGKRDLVKRVLRLAVTQGLRAPHQLYFTFRTQCPGVSIPDFLSSQYPEEMTIVLNDSYWNLTVADDHFSVDLLFDQKKSTLRVPYAALVNFIDPSVDFALQFNWQTAEPPIAADNVIFFDHFRKTP
jgi:uncharacterized protein